MDAAAVGGEHTQPPVPDFITKALDDDRGVARHDPRRVALLAQELNEVAGGAGVEVVAGLEHRRILVDRPAAERADRLPELTRAPDAVALPEWDRTRHP